MSHNFLRLSCLNKTDLHPIFFPHDKSLQDQGNYKKNGAIHCQKKMIFTLSGVPPDGKLILSCLKPDNRLKNIVSCLVKYRYYYWSIFSIVFLFGYVSL